MNDAFENREKNGEGPSSDEILAEPAPKASDFELSQQKETSESLVQIAMQTEFWRTL
jgi:hypothetical protein